jgi:hypothetical protein
MELKSCGYLREMAAGHEDRGLDRNARALPDALHLAAAQLTTWPTLRVLQRAGVDHSTLRFKGATAFDYAKQSGDDALLNTLTSKDRTL